MGSRRESHSRAVGRGRRRTPTQRALAAGVAIAAVLATGLSVVLPSDARAATTCNGLAVTIPGTDGDDPIIGTPGDDVIDAGAGNDTITSFGGNDTICAGDGNDVVDAGPGDDWVDGADGADSLIGAAGNDRLNGGFGGNTLRGGAGDDAMDACAGTTVVDYRDAPGPVTLPLTLLTANFTGDGTDSVRCAIRVRGSSFGDTISGDYTFADGGAGDDRITGGVGVNELHGGPGDDTIESNAGRDRVYPGEGSDTITGSATAALPDRDILDYSGEAGPVAITANGGAGTATGVGTDTFTEISDFVATAAGDTLDLRQTFCTSVLAGPGNDLIRVYSTVICEDVVEPGPGDDVVDAVPGGQPDPFTSRDFVVVSYLNEPGGVQIDLDAGTATGAGTDTLIGVTGAYGSQGDDTILGGERGNIMLYGGPGNDLVDGEGGSDEVIGGPGDDTLRGGSGAGSDPFGADDDEVGYVRLSFDPVPRWDAPGPVTVDLKSGVANGDGNDTLSGFESAHGSTHDDTMLAADAGSSLYGAGGADTLTGGPGPDRLLGGSGTDQLTGNGGDDVLQAEGCFGPCNGAGGGSLSGGQGNDRLEPSQGADAVDGGDGIDTLFFPGPGFGGPGVGVRVDLAAGTSTGFGSDTLQGIEDVEGTDNADTLIGDSSANRLVGGLGDDLLDGGPAADTMDGRAGTDTCISDIPGDVRISCELPPATTGTIVVILDTVPDDPQDVGFAAPAPIGVFTLDDDTDPLLPATRTFGDVAPGVLAVSQEQTSGWTPTAITCVDPDAGTRTDIATRTATVDLDAGETVTCTFTITAAPSTNRPPTCTPLTATATTGSTIELTPACTDPDGNPLTLDITTQPTKGTATITPNGKLRYTTTSTTNTTDSFTYTANDGTTTSTPATITITIEARTYRVTVRVSGPGTIRSADGRLDCGRICTATYPRGAGATLKASAAKDAVFVGYGGDCRGTICLVASSGRDLTITATFVRCHPGDGRPGTSRAGSDKDARDGCRGERDGKNDRGKDPRKERGPRD